MSRLPRPRAPRRLRARPGARHPRLRPLPRHARLPRDPAGEGCTLVDRPNGFVVIKDDDPAKPAAWLLVPDVEVTGIEDSRVLVPPVVAFWSHGWRVGETLLPGRRLALAINSKGGRSQDLLHIHISCLDPRWRETLAAAAVGPGWTSRAHPRRPRLPRPPHRRPRAEPLPPPPGAARRPRRHGRPVPRRHRRRRAAASCCWRSPRPTPRRRSCSTRAAADPVLDSRSQLRQDLAATGAFPERSDHGRDCIP